MMKRFDESRPRMLIAVAAFCASAAVLGGVLSVFSPPRAPPGPVVVASPQSPTLAAAAAR